MKVIATILFAFVALAASESLQDFILRLEGGERCRILKIMKDQNNGRMPADVKPILDNHKIRCPGVYPPDFQVTLSDADWSRIWESIERVEQNKQNKRKNFKPRTLGTPGIPCATDAVCPIDQVCVDRESLVRKAIEQHNATEYWSEVKTTLQLDGKSCVNRFNDFVYKNSTRLMGYIYQSFNNIQQTLAQAGARGGFERYLQQMEFATMFDFQYKVADPVARQGEAGVMYQPGPANYGPAPAGGDNLLLFFLLPELLGGGDDKGDSLLLLMLLGQDLFGTGLGGQGGFDILSNPFLLLSLLGDEGLGGGDDLITLLILTQSTGNGDSGAGFLLPLLLLMGDDDMGDLLPLLLLGGGLGGGSCGGGLGAGGLDTILLLYVLKGGEGGEDGMGELTDLLLYTTLLGGGNCDPYEYQTRSGMMGQSSGLEMILLLELLNEGEGEGMGGIMKNPLFFFLFLGGLGTGGTGGIDSAILLLLLSEDMDLSNSYALFFLADPRFANNPLALLLLFNDGLDLGGDGEGGLFGGDMSELLILSLFFTNGDAGNVGNNGGFAGNLIGTGGGIFEFFILEKLLGGGEGDEDMEIMDLLLFMLLSKQSGPAPVYYQPGPQVVVGQPVAQVAGPYQYPVGAAVVVDPMAANVPIVPYEG